ncbi:GNAT family N-acetyltransferase [Dysgonomonas sp. HGC4]|uniref:GNAT family N-acetyltransferase n=1 Tax=Dysgonomonas sp. HGC4 TaxID=1658009 RepID=UPI00068346F2|nr:GNAT family N-acetyltransferase [Dysgonomonas sp. HGC4]MBD8348929.1 GNAT family N-acetyltransferase [Dysgonomonas sp. HGC4]
MIQFANKNTAPEVRSMWKICFEDTDEYMDLYFSRQYRDENTLIYWVDNKAVASLQMIPYSIRFYGEVIPFYYLAGLCTLSEYRNKGYMGKLIRESFSIMRARNIPLSILVPAEEWLFGYYERYGFTTTFDKGTKDIEFSKFLKKHESNCSNAYQEFDKTYQQNDFCVLKSEYDFETIIKEYLQDECPPKHNLAAMSCIIYPSVMLRLYAQKNLDKNFKIKVEDDIYQISQGKVEQNNSSDFDIAVNINMLARLLFGFHTNELATEYSSLFEEHQPILNLMLE